MQDQSDDERAEVLIAEARMLLWSEGAPAALAKIDELESLEVSPHIDREVGVWRSAIAGSASE